MRIIYIVEGEILQIGYPFPSGNPEQGFQPDGTYVVYSEDLEGLNDHDFIELRYWDGTYLQDRPRRPNDLCLWIDGSWVVNKELYLARVRASRSMLLYKTDWTQLADAPLTTEQIQEATMFRQELRDMIAPIIANPDAYVQIEDAPWPIPPEWLNVS